jgi:hypothetical protein
MTIGGETKLYEVFDPATFSRIEDELRKRRK